MTDQLDEYKEHNDIIREYGRDPRRNKLMERENTPKEAEYLKQCEVDGGFDTMTVSDGESTRM